MTGDVVETGILIKASAGAPPYKAIASGQARVLIRYCGEVDLGPNMLIIIYHGESLPSYKPFMRPN